MINIKDIYEKCRGGLDIILMYYPEAVNSIENLKNPFKARGESTPSAYLRLKNDVYKVIDFGDDAHEISPIDLYIREERCTYTEAIFRLAEIYGVNGTYDKLVNKADIRHEPAKTEEAEGAFTFELNKGFTDAELNVFCPAFKTPEEDDREDVLINLKWYSVKWYAIVKDRKKTIIASNENFPIFMRDCDGFWKVYKPKEPEKKNRFMYKKGTVDKPKDYINGYTQLVKAHALYNEGEEKKFFAIPANENKPYVEKKLPECFICSGERDAACVAAMGYYPIWFNSESYRMSENDWYKISNLVERVYNVPDLDETGRKKGIELAMTYLDIHTVWLPEWLAKYRDARSKPRKDLRDFCELRPRKKYFKELLNLAMPMRFWEKIETGKGGWRWEVNSDYTQHFLMCNGFCTIEDKNAKSGKMFVRIQDNKVTQIFSKEIRAFLRSFVRERYLDINIRNLVNNTTRLSEQSLELLDEVKPDFINYGPLEQFFFFNNATWAISAKGITEYKPSQINKYVWDEEVVPHKVKRLDPAFECYYDEEKKQWRIHQKNVQSTFYKYLTNTSRVHWRTELEEKTAALTPEEREAYISQNKFNISGSLLSEADRLEQELHLVNKIFAIGYLLHRHKSANRPWAVFAMDNKINEGDESNGRSGKSFCFKTLRMFMRSVTLPGRNPKLTENPHIYDRVNEYVKFVLVDDANEYLDFNYFFDVVGGDMTVNPKNNKSYEIPFNLAPKFAFTSNYTLRRFDPSTEGRILYTVFSDYYHQKTADNDYKETRQISDDFGGKNLFGEGYTEEEWNADINFLMECVQFYLSTIPLKVDGQAVKIMPPMTNVLQRNLLTEMTHIFRDWAEVYFDKDGENVDCEVPREVAFNHFIETTKQRKWTTQKFSKALIAYAKWAPHIVEMNPKAMQNGQGRIIRKWSAAPHEPQKSTEMIFMATTLTANTDFNGSNNEPAEMPF